MISKETIDKVFESARVEEVIGDFVQLKRAGSNFKGLSPFSDERSPSFMVSPVKQIWKDFSSGKGGNSVAFLMEHEHFSYPEAIRYLAKKYNIEIEETELSDDDKAEANEKESMYLVSEFAATYFHDTLLRGEEGKAIGLSYFKERGFTNETIAKFKLGYSPTTWDAFTKEALGKGYQLEYLEKTGLTIVGEDKQFDRFKSRVMFPIQSMSGRVLGFGGRILTQDKKAAKYLNSPESEIYHKSKVLYGIFHAKQAIAKLDNCFLVEGYTDVIQMHQSGIENVVASSGTALTSDQIRLINRLTKNITVLFDGDAAGLRASIRGIDLILEEGMNVKVCTFPDGEDPDSFARKNSFEDLTLYLSENAKDFIQFKASLLMKEAKNDPIKKADLIRDMVTSISKIPDRIKREIYIQECSRIMEISEEVLFNTLAQLVKKDLQELGKKFKEEQVAFEVHKNEVEIIPEIASIFLYEKEIVKTLLLYGQKELEFEEDYLKIDENGREIDYTEKKNKKIYEYLYLNLQQDEIEFSNNNFKNFYESIINKLLLSSELLSNNEEEKDFTELATDIIMNDQKYTLDGWLSKKNVYVKDKENEEELVRLTTDIVISYRECLIGRLLNDLLPSVVENRNEQHPEILQSAIDYNNLKVRMTKKIGRMRTNNDRY